MRILLIFRSLIVLAFIFNLCSCEQQKYPWGKDTYALFGNGRFSIDRVYVQSQKIFGLYDGEKQVTIIYDVYSFYQDGDLVYAYGSTNNQKYFVALNYVTGEYSRYQSVEQAPAEFRGNLSKLSTSRTLPN